ncbi:MAG: hypothetical protein N2746_09605 [Deltaproteobacteria bacterium]|nr:hypothetical protein [Deltaproteobacteria bacterium]
MRRINSKDDFEELLKKYNISEYTLIRGIMRNPETNRYFINLLKFRDIMDEVKNKDADKSDLLKFLEGLSKVDVAKSVDEYESNLYESKSDTGNNIKTYIWYDYDRLGNVNKEVVYHKEFSPAGGLKRTIGGSALCYRYVNNMLVSVEIDSSFDGADDDGIGVEPSLPDDFRERVCDSVIGNRAVLSRYWYDYKGRMIAEKSWIKGLKFYIYDILDRILFETDKDGIVLTSYVWLGNMPVAQIVWAEMSADSPPSGCSPSNDGSQCSIISVNKEVKDDIYSLLICVFIIGIFYANLRVFRRNKTIGWLMLILSSVAAMMLIKCTPTIYTEPVVFWYHTDNILTPEKMTDVTGKVVWEIKKKYPFGNFVFESYLGGPYGKDRNGDEIYLSPENNLRFSGQYYFNDRAMILDKAKGLYYNYNRWYNPDTGRYMEMELIDKMGHIDYGNIPWIKALFITTRLNNSYVYSYNNPIRWTDIYGLRPGDVFYDIDDAIDDALAYTYSLVSKAGIEYGGCIYYAFDPNYMTKIEGRCKPVGYMYEVPYYRATQNKDPRYTFAPIQRVVCVVYFHGHMEDSAPGVSPEDREATQFMWGNSWAAMFDSMGDIYYIDRDGNVRQINKKVDKKRYLNK